MVRAECIASTPEGKGISGRRAILPGKAGVMVAESEERGLCRQAFQPTARKNAFSPAVKICYKWTIAFSAKPVSTIDLQQRPSAFDVLITDQTMPVMTGLDLARNVLRLRPGLPIILCTGYSSLVDEASAKRYGIGGFLAKPLLRKELAKLLRDLKRKT